MFLIVTFLLVQAEAVILRGCKQRQNSLLGKYDDFSQACCPVGAPNGAYFFHVPKAGGTSIRYMLEEYLEAVDFTYCHHADNIATVDKMYYNCQGTVESKIGYLSKVYRGRFMRECNAISSHNDATLLNILNTHRGPQKQVLDIIVLRDPINRALSELKFTQFQMKNLGNEVASLDDLDAKPRYLDYLRQNSNRMAKMLSGFFGCYDFSVESKRQGEMDEKHLEDALINLSQFCVIIIMEEPECGLMRLGSIFRGQAQEKLNLRKTNKGLNYEWSAEYLSVANQSNQFDIAIYNKAIELNKLQC